MSKFFYISKGVQLIAFPNLRASRGRLNAFLSPLNPTWQVYLAIFSGYTISLGDSYRTWQEYRQTFIWKYYFKFESGKRTYQVHWIFDVIVVVVNLKKQKYAYEWIKKNSNCQFTFYSVKSLLLQMQLLYGQRFAVQNDSFRTLIT